MKKGMLKLEEVDCNNWEFEYPESTFHLDDRLYEGVDLMNSGGENEAEEIFRTIIKEFPEHIDAYHHLAMVMDSQGMKEESLRLWEKAVDVGMQCFPDDFTVGKDLLEWGWIENRPFLRASHGLGLAYLEKGEVEKAVSIFNDMLSFNPNDNQGIRALLVECNFALNKPEEVFKVCDKYPDDAMADTLYGRPLALFQLGKKDEAEKAMKNAIKYLPLVAKELTKKRHSQPKNMMEGYTISGGPDEAYDYWKRFGKYWKGAEGGIDFVNKYLSKHRK